MSNQIILYKYYEKCLKETCPYCIYINSCGFGKEVIINNEHIVALKLLNCYQPQKIEDIEYLIRKCCKQLCEG